ncbi:MAG: hypothetical protein KDA29_00785 [Phycisphaerales bacterium]|nr:hypothetical protein [Phycisphaerales bacterium]
MSNWLSPTGTLAITLWLLIMFSGAFGCGNDGPDSVGLPNGYTLSSWDWEETWVEDSNGERIGDGHFSILKCQVESDLFYGVYHDHHRRDQRIRAYFIIDTARDKYQPFMDKAEWEKVLNDLGGVESPALIPVGDFASVDMTAGARLLGRLVIGTVIGTLIFIILVLWGCERARRRAFRHRL